MQRTERADQQFGGDTAVTGGSVYNELDYLGDSIDRLRRFGADAREYSAAAVDEEKTIRE